MRLNDEGAKFEIAGQAHVVATTLKTAQKTRDPADLAWYEKEHYAFAMLCSVFELNQQKILRFLETNDVEVLLTMKVGEFAERFTRLRWE